VAEQVGSRRIAAESNRCSTQDVGQEPLPRRFDRALNADRPRHGGIPGRPQPIEVVAHIRWEQAGEQWHRALAVGWTSTHVLVELCDPAEYVGKVVHLQAHDVKRAH
jgi:hypothetical protein